MKVEIAELSEVGTRFERDLDDAGVRELLSSATLEMAPGEGFAKVRLDLFCLEKVVHLHGSLLGAYHVPCARCLGPARVELAEEQLSLSFLPKAAWVDEGEEIALEAEDLETYAHDGVVVDIGELLREHLVLALPIAPLCREDCEGLEAATSEPELEVEGSLSGWKAQLARLKEDTSKS